MTIDYRTGDTRDLCAALPDGSVHLVATSPPFLALRSYLPADHEHKHAEIGSEPDPAAFLDTLLGLTAEWGRVLAPWGSIAIELGDTYAGSAGAFRDAPQDEVTAGNHRVSGGFGSPIRNMNNKIQGGGDGWPRPKSLALIPQLYATSLAYGRNILTGQPSPVGQWLVRNVIVWHRPNPAVGALGDKFRPSTSYIVVATRSTKRWFDLSAVRTQHKDARELERFNVATPSRSADARTDATSGGDARGFQMHKGNPAGAPPLDCWFDADDHDTWTITTQPSRLAHYAMWPAKLAERLILSMCPEWVCATCGEPRRRIEGRTERYAAIRNEVGDFNQRNRTTGALSGNRSEQLGKLTCAENVTLGWTDCGHDTYVPGVVLDPFAGTFTTGLVADLHNRHGIGFDLNASNAALVDARRAEVARNLFGTVPEIPGQLDIFGGDAA